MVRLPSSWGSRIFYPLTLEKRMFLTASKFLAWDTETNGLSTKHGCRMFAWSGFNQDGEIFYFEAKVDPETRQPQWSKAKLNKIKKLLKEYKVQVLHNATFDLKVILKELPEIQEYLESIEIHDTMDLCHLFDSKSPQSLKDQSVLRLEWLDDDEEDLDNCVKDIRKIVKDWEGWSIAEKHGKSNPGQNKDLHKCDFWLPAAYANSEFYDQDCGYSKEYLKSVCKKYAVMDAKRTAGLFLFYCELLDSKLKPAYEMQRRCTWPLVKIENHGLHLLPEKFGPETEEASNLAIALTKILKSTSKNPELNPNSGLQITEVVYGYFEFECTRKTKKGNPSTDKTAINDLDFRSVPTKKRRNAKRFIAALKDYKAVNTALTYLNSYHRFAIDSVLYPNIRKTGTSTTRVSSYEPNGQNVSKGKEIVNSEGETETVYSLRRVFGPTKDKIWYAVDYKQLQITIFAYLSKEKQLIKAIEQGYDYHNFVACRIFNTDSPTSLERRVAKAINFGIIFGAGVKKINLMAGMFGAFELFARLFPNVPEYIAKKSLEAKKNGFIRTASGYPLVTPRKRHYAAVNYEVQGTEGDIVKYGMGNLYSELKNSDVHLMFQVHDEFLFETTRKFHNSPQAIHTKDLIIKTMRNAGDHFGVPVDVDFEMIDESWASPKPFKQSRLNLPKTRNRYARLQTNL